MDVRKLLEEVKRGDTSIEEAENAFKNLPYEDLGYAKLDLHRKLRSGFRVPWTLPPPQSQTSGAPGF